MLIGRSIGKLVLSWTAGAPQRNIARFFQVVPDAPNVRGYEIYSRSERLARRLGLDIDARLGLTLLTWLVVVGATSLIIGPERNRKWFRARDTSKSFFNRRGFLGDFMNFGVPQTREGWAICAGFLTMMLVTGYIALG